MTEIFEWIGYIFEDILFIPLDALRELQLDSWFAANAINWIFLIVGVIAFGFWLKKLKEFGEEDDHSKSKKEPSPYLG